MEAQRGVNAEQVVKKWVDAWNRHDIDSACELVDPNFVEYTSAWTEPLRGKEANRKSDESAVRAMPDVHIRILNIMAKGDTVATELMWTGTLTGPYEFAGRPVPPTGRHYEYAYAEFYRVNSKGLIVEQRSYLDALDFKDLPNALTLEAGRYRMLAPAARLPVHAEGGTQ